MSCFILDNVDSNGVNNFSILREIIEKDDFKQFLNIYDNIISNFSIYKVNNPNYNENGNYIKLKIHKSDWFDAYIIFWGPNSLSKIHDHSDNGCLFKVIKGNLKERIYSKSNLLSFDVINRNCNNIGEIHNSQGYHSMENISEDNEVAVSVHFYSPPDYNMNVFN